MNDNHDENYVNVLRNNRLKAEQADQKIHISVVTNVTLEPLYDNYLKASLLQSKIDAHVNFISMDKLMAEMLSKQVIVAHSDIIIVLLNFDMLTQNITSNQQRVTNKDRDQHTHHLQQLIRTLMEELRSQTESVILWHLFDSPYYISSLKLQSKRNHSQSLIWELNQFVMRQCDITSNLIALESNSIFTRYGAEQLYDRRLWHLARIPYSKKGYYQLTKLAASYIAAFRGKGKKCVVLDCDEVLWGGILGEEGIGGIKLSPDHPGSAYYEFQAELLDLYRNGLLLTLCSKNNEADVLQVLAQHPHMLLREEHLAAYEVNWDSKADNIVKLAHRLNISLDSMIFMDDSEYEINLIRHELPEVKTVLLPVGKPYMYRDMLLDLVELKIPTPTNEDMNRTRMYQEESKRREDQETNRYANKMDYYKSLQMQVHVSLVDDLSVLRVAQLTQKTNQFNLTGLRCTEDDIRRRSLALNYDVIICKFKDRFGDMGIVAAATVHYLNTDEAEIENFVLSCRAIGRLVEEVLLSALVERVRKRGTTRLAASYKAMTKNNQTESFYEQNNFVLVCTDKGGRRYCCNPQEYQRKEFEFLSEYIFCDEAENY